MAEYSQHKLPSILRAYLKLGLYDVKSAQTRKRKGCCMQPMRPKLVFQIRWPRRHEENQDGGFLLPFFQANVDVEKNFRNWS